MHTCRLIYAKKIKKQKLYCKNVFKTLTNSAFFIMFHLQTFKINSFALLRKFICTQSFRFATISSNYPELKLNSNTNDTIEAFELLKRYSLNDQLGQLNTSWNNCIAKAKTLVNYDTDLYQETFLSNDIVEKFFTSQKLKKNKHIQNIVSQYIGSYNYQITGLTTVLFAKLLLHSKQFWPAFFYTSNATNDDAKFEADIVQLALFYDMISYGFYFHDCISPLKENNVKNSLKNLQLLVGDYFFAKALLKISSFEKIKLYNLISNTTVKISEGESLALTASDNFDKFQTIQKFVNYCHLSTGHLIGISLQSALYQANFSRKAQKLAFEFGNNFGIAIKIANQLSALFVSKLTNGNMVTENATNFQLPVNHFNLSYYAKFPTINPKVMQNLVEEYSNRAICLLDLLCDQHAVAQLDELLDFKDWSTIVFDKQKLPLGESAKHQNSGQKEFSKKSAEMKEALVQIIQQVQSFNSQNFARYASLFPK